MPFNEYSRIIIVGSGVFGLSSALHLAKEGFRDITVFDRLDLASINYESKRGADTASGELNKVFRIFYGKKNHYQKLALEAGEEFNNWNDTIKELPEKEKERYSALKIIDDTGFLRLDDIISQSEVNNLKGFEESGLLHTQFDINDPEDFSKAEKLGLLRKLNPGNIKDRTSLGHLYGTLDTSSGLIYASRACTYVNYLTRRLGVKYITGAPEGSLEKIIKDEAGNTKGIITEDGVEHTADLVILAAGPWTTLFVPELDGLSEAASGNVVLIKVPEDSPDLREKYSVSNFPIVGWKQGQERESTKLGGFVLFPVTEPEGYLKIVTRQVKYTNPVDVGARKVSVPKTKNSSPPENRLTKRVINLVKDFMKIFTPDLVEAGIGVSETQLLWYTNTINNDFIVDFVPHDKNLLVFTGGSGHAFKFLPVLGKFVVNKLKDESNFYTEIFKWRDPSLYPDINSLSKATDKARIYDEQDLLTDSDLVFSDHDLHK